MTNHPSMQFLKRSTLNSGQQIYIEQAQEA